MSEQLRSFDLGDILSITDGRLVSPRLMDGVCDIVDYMTGDSISTIGLLSAAPVCRTALLEQYPHLAVTCDDTTKLNATNYMQWVADWKKQFGDSLPVTPLKQWDRRGVADDILDVIRINPNVEIMTVEA